MGSFVLTLGLARDSREHFERLRQAYYPADLNRVPAHLSLLHYLPAGREAEIDRTLSEIAAEQDGFTMQVTGLRHLGRGVAYSLRSEELMALHATLAGRFAEHLIAQDRPRFSPHIVIQNKVAPETSCALHRTLSERFAPFSAEATGLLLWHYLEGPWELARFYPWGKKGPVP